MQVHTKVLTREKHAQTEESHGNYTLELDVDLLITSYLQLEIQ